MSNYDFILFQHLDASLKKSTSISNEVRYLLEKYSASIYVPGHVTTVHAEVSVLSPGQVAPDWSHSLVLCFVTPVPQVALQAP